MKHQTFRLAAILLFAFAASVPGRAITNNNSGAANTDAPPVPPSPVDIFKPSFGVVTKASLLGVGGDVGVTLTPFFNVRGGFSGMNFTHGFSSSGIHYDGTLHLRSAEALVDITPLGDWFHVSPGVLVYNGNKITANASVPGGQQFDLGSASFISSASNPITGTGLMTVNKAAPMIMFGFGNPIPHHHRFTFFHEFGIVFQGTPKTTLNLAGTACDATTGLACANAATDPTIQAQIKAEQDKINKDNSFVKFYPVGSIGFGFRF